MFTLQHPKLFSILMIINKSAKSTINDFNLSFWELKDNEIYWSKNFLSNLHYSKRDINFKLDYFLNDLIHKDDNDQFKNNFFALIKSNTPFRQSILIKSKKGKYKEFVCSTNEDLSSRLDKSSKFIFFSKRKLKTNKKVNTGKFFYKQTAEMSKTGSWYIDFIKRKTYWDQQTRRILEYPEDYIPSLKNSANYYPKRYQDLAVKSFLDCANHGKSFNIEIKMLTKNKREFWVKALGKPVFNDNRDIIGIRGVFQDIDTTKTKELGLQKTSNIIASQNKRLFNFAHIVSHNLRSHTSNLTLIAELINSCNHAEEKLDLINNVEDIAKSLSDTIEHLNEIVTVHTNVNKSKTLISFDKILNQVLTSINQIIIKEDAQINADFSNVIAIRYISAYMESIILNLITNAIKYKHPDRKPIINIKTYIENSSPVLEVSDNGLGIDLDKFGDKIFGMYKTFHYNEDAVGIGLFITKNQVEALHGEISVESEVNKGTTFKVKF